MKNRLDGVILLDKPSGLSSNQALQQVKKLVASKKAGHTGTLDPLASGLLPICLGHATRFASFLLDGSKEYYGTAQLGVVTDSGDSEGQVLMTREVQVNFQQLLQACATFSGEITQIPPMYSALKHHGRPLYEYARAGIEIARAPRQVHIEQLELLDYAQDVQQFSFRALVSKGTYIRSLVQDIGELLGCGAMLSALRRSKTNDFSLEQAVDLEGLAHIMHNSLPLPLLPSEVLVHTIPAYHLNQQQFAIISYGNIVTLTAPLDFITPGSELRLYAAEHFLGVATYRQHEQQLLLCPKRLLPQLCDLQPWL